MARHSNLNVSKQDSQIYEEDAHKQNKRGAEHKRDTQAFKLDYGTNLLVYYSTSGPKWFHCWCGSQQGPRRNDLFKIVSDISTYSLVMHQLEFGHNWGPVKSVFWCFNLLEFFLHFMLPLECVSAQCFPCFSRGL